MLNILRHDLAKLSVSIRTRPEGRVMPLSPWQEARAIAFQSAPGPRAG